MERKKYFSSSFSSKYIIHVILSTQNTSLMLLPHVYQYTTKAIFPVYIPKNLTITRRNEYNFSNLGVINEQKK